eukprot:CAMPEP_0185263932 /NCGR_PEP_ID=MMETSP1359-20130426/16974_1 /TAXON_ID=552665 /ORGANISM="Bigelowiella longifila, Strain CCMP242" /LENGTH=278 /DNA_ID=CAMNT_0027851831 /DNA_START=351 /DNA_END=1187 /DNA_ORIENTATION=+
MILTPSSSSYSVPSLPEEVNKKTLIHFDALPANIIIKKLRRELDKLDCEYSSAKNKIEGKIIQGTELYDFCASLYTLDPKEGGKVRRLGLDLQLLQGERAPWFRFIAKLADVLEGKVDHNVREFVEGYFDLPNLGSFSGQCITPDREYLKSCIAMVESGFIENQVSGLKGIKETLDICSRGDILAMNLASPVLETINKTIVSKDLTVIRIASDLLVKVSILHQDDVKICDSLQAVWKKIENFVAEQLLEGFELRYIKKKIGKCRSLLNMKDTPEYVNG